MSTEGDEGTSNMRIIASRPDEEGEYFIRKSISRMNTQDQCTTNMAVYYDLDPESPLDLQTSRAKLKISPDLLLESSLKSIYRATNEKINTILKNKTLSNIEAFN